MEDISKILNEDVVYYIKKNTCDIIKTDCKILFDFYVKEKKQMPTEPPTGKAYYIWINYMINYTKLILPVEKSIDKLYEDINNLKDFDELQIMYVKFKELIDEWYDLKTRYKYSDYYKY